MAFVTVTKPQLRQMAKTNALPANKILKLRENPERTLSVIQIGITLVGMISAAVGGAGAEESFAPFFEQRYGLSENAAEGLAIFLVVLPLTIFSVVLGELVPKTIALRSPLRISVMGAKWIALADKFLSPLVSFLEWATKLIIKFFPKKAETVMTELQSTLEIDHLSAPTKQYLMNLAATESRRAKQVMVPWEQVFKLNDSDSRGVVAGAVITSGHTRLPVIRGTEVVGLLHAKEFIALLATESEDWLSILRPALIIKEDDLALSVLRLMQSKRSNLCVVVSKENRPVGIVTLEDVIEEIVGDLFDEDDDGRTRQILAQHSRTRSR